MTGDFNAQTGDLNDFTSVDLFLSDFFHFDQETVEFYSQKDTLERLGVKLNRTTQDKKKNNSGFRLVDICKNHNLSILNGRFGRDMDTGSLTFRDKSTIDYAITSGIWCPSQSKRRSFSDTASSSFHLMSHWR